MGEGGEHRGACISCLGSWEMHHAPFPMPRLTFSTQKRADMWGEYVARLGMEWSEVKVRRGGYRAVYNTIEELNANFLNPKKITAFRLAVGRLFAWISLGAILPALRLERYSSLPKGG